MGLLGLLQPLLPFSPARLILDSRPQFAILGPPDTEFAGGLYHGRVQLPPEYPFKPPAFSFLSPTGRFEVGVKICLSISNFHPEHWQPSWSIRTALTALIAFMSSPPEGAVGSLDCDKGERRRLAAESRKGPPGIGAGAGGGGGGGARGALARSLHERLIAVAPPLPQPQQVQSQQAQGAGRREADAVGGPKPQAPVEAAATTAAVAAEVGQTRATSRPEPEAGSGVASGQGVPPSSAADGGGGFGGGSSRGGGGSGGGGSAPKAAPSSGALPQPQPQPQPQFQPQSQASASGQNAAKGAAPLPGPELGRSTAAAAAAQPPPVAGGRAGAVPVTAEDVVSPVSPPAIRSLGRMKGDCSKGPGCLGNQLFARSR